MPRLFRNLTFQVLVAIALGVLLGVTNPVLAARMKPLGDTFVNLVKMVIAPIIFLTIVLGIANMADLRRVGRVGGKALLYFEIVSTLALAIGLVVVTVLHPGASIDVSALAKGDVSQYATQGAAFNITDLLLHIVPSSAVDAFARGDVLQVVFVALLFGIALGALRDRAQALIGVLDQVMHVLFRIVAIIMMVAPIGAFGAMAFTIGTFGLRTLLPLGKLMLCVYITMFLFVFVVLGAIARVWRFSLLRYLRFIREELLIVLGTSSSEAVLPRMIDRMEQFGCGPAVVGLVIPTGYSFNLDGTSIYLSMSVVFLAQAFHVTLAPVQLLTILGILMLTSKGAAGVTGSGFIVLASTLSAMRVVPVEGIALLLGVDRFMSEARAIVNLIGNGVATIVIAKSEREWDEGKYERS